MAIKLTLSFWETMINTWIVMAVIVGFSAWVTRGLRAELPISRRQHVLESIVEAIQSQVAEIAGKDQDVRAYLPFVGSLFLFIAASNVLSIIPRMDSLFPSGPAVFHQPTAAVETTAALAICVLLAVPIYAIRKRGWGHWARTYFSPTPLLFPFNVMGELTRTLSLAARLFGNVMSGTVIGAIALSLIPFFFPVVMQAFGLVTGVIQAYIFAVLAMVYIASAAQVEKRRERNEIENSGSGGE